MAIHVKKGSLVCSFTMCLENTELGEARFPDTSLSGTQQFASIYATIDVIVWVRDTILELLS